MHGVICLNTNEFPIYVTIELFFTVFFFCIYVDCLLSFQGFSKTDHHRSDSAPAVDMKPLPKGKHFFLILKKKRVFNGLFSNFSFIS